MCVCVWVKQVGFNLSTHTFDEKKNLRKYRIVEEIVRDFRRFSQMFFFALPKLDDMRFIYVARNVYFAANLHFCFDQFMYGEIIGLPFEYTMR